MKKTILFIFFAFMAATSFAQQDYMNTDSVPLAVRKTFDSLYKGAKDLWWYNENDGYAYIAEFQSTSDSVESIDFNPDGSFKAAYSWKSVTVPQSVNKNFNSLFPQTKHILWSHPYNNDSKELINEYEVEFAFGPENILNKIIYSANANIIVMEVKTLDSLQPKKMKDYLNNIYKDLGRTYIEESVENSKLVYTVEFWPKSKPGDPVGQADVTYMTFDLKGNLLHKKTERKHFMVDPTW